MHYTEFLEELILINSNTLLNFQKKIANILDKFCDYNGFEAAFITLSPVQAPLSIIYSSNLLKALDKKSQDKLHEETVILSQKVGAEIFVHNDVHKQHKYFLTKAYIAIPLRYSNDVVTEHIIHIVSFHTLKEDQQEQLLQTSNLISKLITSIIVDRNKYNRIIKYKNNFLKTQRKSSLGTGSYDPSEDKFTASPELFRMLGYRANDLPPTIQEFRNEIHPDDLTNYLKHIQASIYKGTADDFEFRIYTKHDRELIYVRVIIDIIKDDRGKIVEVIGTVIDITKQKKLEQQLQDTNNFLNLIINSIPSPISVKDENLNYAFCNEAFSRAFGYNKALTYRSVDEIQQNIPELSTRIEKMEQNFVAYRSNAVIHYEEITSHLQKTYIVHDIFCTDSSGKKYIITTTQDITKLKQYESEMKEYSEKLEHSNQFLRSILNAIPAPLTVKDINLNYILVNKTFIDMVGKSEQEILNTNSRKLYFDLIGNHSISDSLDNALLAYKQNHNNNFVQFNITIGSIPYLINHLVFTVPEEKTYILCFAHDLTEIKRYEADLLNKNKELEEAKNLAEAVTQLKSDFVANISHEIRNPLNALIGASELLAESSFLAPDDQDYLNIIRDASTRMLTLINEILDFSKIEAGQVELSNAPFDLYTELVAIINLFSISAQEKGLVINLDYDLTSVPRFVIGNASKIAQIIQNLVGNAIKFTNVGEVTIKVTATNRREAKTTFSIIVKDTGIGIDVSKQKFIFGKFFQANHEIEKKYGGTGLGLSICQKLATLMGGKIEVESALGKGSEFNFIVDLELAQDKILTNPVPVEETSNENIKAKILVVEDNPNNQFVISSMLKKLNVKLVQCYNGDEAIRLLKTTDIDLILMDCQMPVMDGYTTTAMIKDMEDNKEIKKIPIIAITAYASKEDKKKCLEAGMSDYLAKPIHFQELTTKISKWLAKNENSRKVEKLL
jgi:PAS domain S-box-containing protein